MEVEQQCNGRDEAVPASYLFGLHWKGLNTVWLFTNLMRFALHHFWSADQESDVRHTGACVICRFSEMFGHHCPMANVPNCDWMFPSVIE